MICSISGETPQDPVVSKYGHVYEQRLIEKHLVNDLIPLKIETTVKPRPPTATSIPAMIHLFQAEWDSLLLESFSMRQQIQTLRQELSHALYQKDAAIRVIARLKSERESAIAQLLDTKKNISSMIQSQPQMDVETAPSSIPSETITAISQLSAQLRARRKQAAKLQHVDDFISKFSQKSSIDTKNIGGLRSIEMLSDGSALVGGDGVLKIDCVKNKIIKSIKLTSEDPCVAVRYDTKRNYWIVGTQRGTLIDIHIHPTGDHLFVALEDKWIFYDMNSLKQLSMRSTATISSFVTHPDGLVFATGVGSIIKLWDIQSQESVLSLNGHNTSAIVTALEFSENGFFLASGDSNGNIFIWDLRSQSVVQSVSLNGQIACMSFDSSGRYLAIAAENNVNIYSVKSQKGVPPLTHLLTFDDYTALVSGVSWGNEAKSLASISMDRVLRVYG